MQPTNNALQAPLILATIALAIWLLNWMQPVLVPIALAILLTFVLSPVITRLERLGSPRVPAVILVVVLASAIIGSIGWLVARQVSDLVESFPQYEQNLSAKIESLRSEEGGFVDRIQRIAEKITRDLEKSDAAAVDITRVGQGSEPLPVKVVTDASPFQLSELWSAFGPVVQPLSIVGFAVVLRTRTSRGRSATWSSSSRSAPAAAARSPAAGADCPGWSRAGRGRATRRDRCSGRSCRRAAA